MRFLAIGICPRKGLPTAVDPESLSDVSSNAYRKLKRFILQPAGAEIPAARSRRTRYAWPLSKRLAPTNKEVASLGPLRSRRVSPQDDQVDPQEYARLLDLYDSSFRNIAEGEVVKGTVLKVTAYRSHRRRRLQVRRASSRSTSSSTRPAQVTVKPGDIVDVLLESTEDANGHVVLSKEKAEKMKIWDEVEKAYAERKVVIGRVIERIKGGLSVDIGVKAFLPGSQVDLRPVRNLDALLGQELRVQGHQVQQEARQHRALAPRAPREGARRAEEARRSRSSKEGKVVEGIVKNITDYGAFIDLGGIDGLLHITDMSWGRVNHPSELFQVGDEVDVMVLKFDADDRARLARPQADQRTIPWTHVDEQYPVGTRVQRQGRQRSPTTARSSSSSRASRAWSTSPRCRGRKRVKHPSKMVNVGDTVEAVVLDIDPAARRISLGMKQLEQNPWTS